MKAFFDTSVLIATFYAQHEHHGPSFELFVRYPRHEVCCSSHSLAEVYATLTRMPGKDKASPHEALLFLGSIRERLEVISLTPEEYFEALAAAANWGLPGGAAYDALIGHCGLKSQAETIYTWNLKHFKRLDSRIVQRLSTP